VISIAKQVVLKIDADWIVNVANRWSCNTFFRITKKEK